MAWHLDKSRPICPQICEQLCVQIAAGELKPNERLLSVREVALAAGVNPNTVQKSFEMLEQQHLIYAVRGSGWFVSEDTDLARQTVSELIRQTTAAYFAAMEALGCDAAQTRQAAAAWEPNAENSKEETTHE